MTVLFRSNRSNPNTVHKLTMRPIRASVLSYYSKYFENIHHHDESTEHTLSAPPEHRPALELIFNWILQCQDSGATESMPIMDQSYPDLALLHQAAWNLGINGVVERARGRLESKDIGVWEIPVLLSVMSINDISVRLVVRDLAEKHALGEARGDQRLTRQIRHLVKSQRNSKFQQAFAEELDRYRQRLGPIVPGGRSSGQRLLGGPDTSTFIGPIGNSVRKVYDKNGEARLELVRPRNKQQGRESSSCKIM